MSSHRLIHTGVTSLTSSHVSLPLSPQAPSARSRGTSFRLDCQKGTLTAPRAPRVARRDAREEATTHVAHHVARWGGGGWHWGGACSVSSPAYRQARQRARAEVRASGSIKRAPCALSKQVIAWLSPPRSRTVLTVEVAEHRANHKATQLIGLIHAKCITRLHRYRPARAGYCEKRGWRGPCDRNNLIKKPFQNRASRQNHLRV